MSEPQSVKPKKDRGDKSDEESEDLDPKTLRSRQLASKYWASFLFEHHWEERRL